MNISEDNTQYAVSVFNQNYDKNPHHIYQNAEKKSIDGITAGGTVDK